MSTTKRRRIVVDDSALAQSIGSRIRERRRRAGLSQQRLAEGRYTKAYISALETGAAKPSMAALNFIAGRLGTTAAEILANPDAAWTRLEADLLLASGDASAAADAYRDLLEATRTGDPCRAPPVAGRGVVSDRPSGRGDPGRRRRRPRSSRRWIGPPNAPRPSTGWRSAQHLQDNPDEARNLFSGLLAEVRAGLVVAPDFELKLLVALAATESYRGAHDAAVGYLEEARGLSADLDDRRRGIVLLSLANGYRGAGDNEAAIRYGSQALTLLRAAEADLEAAMLENNLALAYLAIGSTERASELVAEAQGIGRHHDDDRLLAHLADTEAQVALASGDAERAIDLAATAIERADRAGATKAADRRLDHPRPGALRARPDRPGARRLRPGRRPRPRARSGSPGPRGPARLGRRPGGRRAPRRGVRPGSRGARRRGSEPGTGSRPRRRSRPPDAAGGSADPDRRRAPPLNRTRTRSVAVA